MPKHPKVIVDQTEKLYHEGVSYRKIADQIGHGLTYVTVSNWVRKYRWEKDVPKYTVNSLKDQLNQCTYLVNKMRPEIDKVDVITPTKDERELLLNYNRYSNLQLKLVRQLTGLKAIDKKPAKSDIFI